MVFRSINALVTVHAKYIGTQPKAKTQEAQD